MSPNLFDFSFESAMLVVLIISTVFVVFRKKASKRAEPPLHITLSVAALVALSLINFGVVFTLAWNGNAGLFGVLFVCGLSFCANVYAAWNQSNMAWKGGLILSGWVLLVGVLSFSEDNAAHIMTFWLSRAGAIYVSALTGGIIARFFAPSFSRP